MNTKSKIAALSLMSFALIGNAYAEDASYTPQNSNLHLAIAMQGDQALLDIRQASESSISVRIHEQMLRALPLQGALKSINGAIVGEAVTQLVAVTGIKR